MSPARSLLRKALEAILNFAQRKAKLRAACLVILTIWTTPAAALPVGEGSSYWVFFNDKGIDSAAQYDAAIASVATQFSPAAIQRRMLRGTSGSIFTEHDLPVAGEYLDAVADTGATINYASSWLNAVSIRVGEQQLAGIAALPGVSHVQPEAIMSRPQAEVPATPVLTGNLSSASAAPSTFYGAAQAQLDQINVPAAHALGYTGAGVTIGVLDTGFKRTHNAFNQPGHPLQVIAENDLIEGDADTSDTTNGQHQHGTYILGTIGAYQPNSMVGAAYDASFLLAKTEETNQEVIAEEHRWVAGLQWLEMNGADLVTSSLGYIDWLTQGDLDGNTAISTVAADIAAANGLPIINAAGNNGNDGNPTTSHLIAPADADRVITVGAVNSSGNPTSFTSDGPTADGRIKPEVLALGAGTMTVHPDIDSSFIPVNGTSLSTPLVASAVALMLQANPSLTVDEIRTGLFSTASLANSPDPLFVRGYGIIDAAGAVQFALDQAPSSQSGIVPEPGSGTMTGLLLLAIARRRRRRPHRRADA